MNFYVGEYYYSKVYKTLAKVTQVGKHNLWFDKPIYSDHYKLQNIGYCLDKESVENTQLIKVSPEMATILYANTI